MNYVVQRGMSHGFVHISTSGISFRTEVFPVVITTVYIHLGKR